MNRKINHLAHRILGDNGIMIRRIDPRPMTSFIKGGVNFEKNLVGIEIGTWEGKNAESILKNLPMKKLYLIDPYIPYEEYGENMEGVYRRCMKRISRYRNKIVFIRKKSEEAIEDIKEKVDFIYIDGNHFYEFVKKDIQLYKLLLKENGIIGGHDIEVIDVSKAVFEEFEPGKVTISSPDWWVKK